MTWPGFITFEGGEGAGKSTQVELLAARLKQRGHDVVRTREPGGTADADIIRNLLIAGSVERWNVTSEILLNYAARDSHLRQLIRPSLADGKIVLCDRFSDSTRVYQGYASGGDLDLIESIDRQIVGSTQPDLTFIFELDPKEGLARAHKRGHADRFESRDRSFHIAVMEGFRKVAAANPDRCVQLDASGDVDTLAELIWTTVLQRAGSQA